MIILKMITLLICVAFTLFISIAFAQTPTVGLKLIGEGFVAPIELIGAGGWYREIVPC